MKTKINTFLVLLFSLVVFSGCAGQPIKLGSSESQINRADIDFSKGRKISASASGFQLLLFIPIQINDRHQRANQLLLAQAGGDYVTEVKVQESWTWGFVGTVYSTTLEAMAYRYK